MFNIDSVQGVAIRNAIANRLDGCVSPVAELKVEKVIYNDPATIVYWSDNTKTVVRCQPGDTFNPELGFLLAVLKKACGNTGIYNELLRKYVPGYGGKKIQTEPSIEQMRKELHDFCRRRSCVGCPLGVSGFQCSHGKFFTTPAGELGHMTDELIIKHYKAMKGEKED